MPFNDYKCTTCGKGNVDDSGFWACVEMPDESNPKSFVHLFQHEYCCGEVCYRKKQPQSAPSRFYIKCDLCHKPSERIYFSGNTDDEMHTMAEGTCATKTTRFECGHIACDVFQCGSNPILVETQWTSPESDIHAHSM